MDIPPANKLRNQQDKNDNEEQHEMSLNRKMMATLLRVEDHHSLIRHCLTCVMRSHDVLRGKVNDYDRGAEVKTLFNSYH